MDTGVGTARDREVVDRLVQRVEGSAELSLDGAVTGLARPAPEPRPLVGDRQLEPVVRPS